MKQHTRSVYWQAGGEELVELDSTKNSRSLESYVSPILLYPCPSKQFAKMSLLSVFDSQSVSLGDFLLADEYP